MSGAMTSTRGPMMFWISSVNRRVSRSFSLPLSSAGSTAIPPFAPPYGRFMMPHFQLIHMASAATSPRSTLLEYRSPPLLGPLVSECWTR
jgi:hypothetical protein